MSSRGVAGANCSEDWVLGRQHLSIAITKDGQASTADNVDICRSLFKRFQTESIWTVDISWSGVIDADEPSEYCLYFNPIGF